MNVSDLKDKVIAGCVPSDLNEDELLECLDFCRRTWIAWRKSNEAAALKGKLFRAAQKDPEFGNSCGKRD